MEIKGTLLIIDDSEDDIEQYRRLLKKSQLTAWTVQVCFDGESGLEQVKNNRYNCILLDYSLPGSDGIEVLSELQSITHDSPIIMLTGQGNENIAATAIKKGAQEYISKSLMTVTSLERAICSAISSVKATQKINAQKQELEQFAKVLAHDLKQPAQSISAMLNIIEREYSSSLPEPVSKKFSLISDTANRMYALINALSSYASLELPQPELEYIELSEIIDSACNNLYQSIYEQQAVINIAALPRLYLIPALAVQLFQILLCNAFLYNTKQPIINISAECKNDQCTISISDNGLGIESAFIEKIFEPLNRLHDNTQYKGTGLGLATAKRIINHHNGKIWCESELSRGSTFYITLPNPQSL